MKKKSLKDVSEPEGKKIPARNYFVVLIVSILVIIISLYVRNFYLNYEANSVNVSVFNNDTISQMNLNDTDYVISETGEAILYVGYTNSVDVRDMEKKLYSDIVKKNLTEKVIYLNVTEYTKDASYATILKSKFPEIKDEITSAPLIIYIKDGKGVEAMSSELKMIDYKVLDKLVSKYGIE